MGTLRFFEEVVSFKIRRTFGFADYSFIVFPVHPGIFCSAERRGLTSCYHVPLVLPIMEESLQSR